MDIFYRDARCGSRLFREVIAAASVFDSDQLYEEAPRRRRMMSISAHDRISGTPQMVRAWDQFLKYAKAHAGVLFMRKDEIARHAIASALTLREEEVI